MQYLQIKQHTLKKRVQRHKYAHVIIHLWHRAEKAQTQGTLFNTA